MNSLVPLRIRKLRRLLGEVYQWRVTIVTKVLPCYSLRPLFYGILAGLLVFGPQPGFASPSTQTLHFPRNAKRVYPEFKKELKKIAKHLRQNPEAILVVTGHTDDTGPERVNRKLSLTRARWIREQLVKLGVGEDRITIRGVANEEPVASGKSSKARKKNRRVEFEIVLDEVADPTEALAELTPEEDSASLDGGSEEPLTDDAAEEVDAAEQTTDAEEEPVGDEAADEVDRQRRVGAAA